MNYTNKNNKSTSHQMGAFIFKNKISTNEYNSIYKKTPSLSRSSSESSNDRKVYYNAESNLSHRSVPHDPYSICKEYTNCSMTSPVFNEDDCD